MPSLFFYEFLTVVVLLALYILIYIGREKTLPPGPSKLPLIGNLHQIPTTGAHFKFTEWAKQYGGIFSLKVGPSTMVVISDRELVKQLLDKKASVYSDRPFSYVSNDLITHGHHLLVMRYGDKWRLFRKLVHQKFREELCESEHVKLIEAEATQMCHDFLTSPEGLMNHPKRFSNSIIMSILFGVRTPSIDDKNMKAFYNMMEEWSQVMETGATPPVDIFPFLKHVPERFFNDWRSRCLHVGRSMTKLYSRMVSHVQHRRAKAGSHGSFLDGVLDQQQKLQLNPDELNFLAGVLMEGGSDTSSSIILAFIDAMVRYPDVQRKAQAEIGRVVGDDRSPTWADFARLPYVSMIVKETMRWRPVTPLAFPHSTTTADTIGTYHIPPQTTVILNVWGLHHLPSQCPSSDTLPPSTFTPERYAEHASKLAPVLATAASAQDRDHYGYGAGRRLCPGIHLAERNLFVAMAKLLWAFEWRPSTGTKGRRPDDVEGDPCEGYTEGFLVCAKPFAAEVRIRSQAKERALEREWKVASGGVLAAFEQGVAE